MSGRVTYGEFDMWNPDGSITFYKSEDELKAEQEAERKAKYEAKSQELTNSWLHGMITKEAYDDELMKLTREYLND